MQEKVSIYILLAVSLRETQHKNYSLDQSASDLDNIEARYE